MGTTFAGKRAAIACAFVLGVVASQSTTVSAFAPGKDGTHPYVVGAGPQVPGPALTMRTTSDYQGIWQKASTEPEPGWALAVAPQGDAVFATWLTYDADGSSMWLAISARDVATMLDDGFAPHTVYAGELYRAFARPGADVALVAYGPAAIAFETADAGVFYYNVDGNWNAKAIERTLFADPIDACSPPNDLRGLWTASAAGTDYEYSGGLHVAQHGDAVVAAMYTYDAQGNAVWRVMAAASGASDAYVGTLYTAQGPAFGAPFDTSKVHIESIGAASLSFGDGARGMLSYVIDGVTAVLPLTRQTLPTRAPACE